MNEKYVLEIKRDWTGQTYDAIVEGPQNPGDCWHHGTVLWLSINIQGYSSHYICRQSCKPPNWWIPADI